MRYFLIGIRIEGFRGVNNESAPLEIKLDKDKMNSIFALNGTGKSSIYDALCYAITGALPKLDRLYPIERTEDYYANRFHSQGVAIIELDLETDEQTPSLITIQVLRNADGSRQVSSPTGTPNPDLILKSLDDSFTLLDYSTFNTFIDHSPLERGRSFSTLLGLDVYSNFRQTLRTTADTRSVRADLDLQTLEVEMDAHNASASTAWSRLDAAYTALTGEPTHDVSQLDKYTARILDIPVGIELLKPLVQGKSPDELNFEEITRVIKDAEGGKDREKLRSVLATLTKLAAIGTLDEEVLNVEKAAIAEIIAEAERLLAATAGAMRKKIYSAADHLIKEGGWHDHKVCPLCSSDLDRSIVEIVTEQQGQYTQFESKNNSLRQTWNASSWRARISKLERAIGNNLPEHEQLFGEFDRKVRDGNVTSSDLEAITTYHEKLEVRLSKAVSTYSAQRQELENRLPPSLVHLIEQIENVRLYLEYRKDYKQSAEKADAIGARLELRKRWQSFITHASSYFAQAEADLSQKKLVDIESDYKDMFAKVMMASDILPNLQRDNTRENLYVELSEFHGLHNKSAKALLSESYRNALAISVYLSAALKHIGNPRFIILDDITSSFDSSHQLNLMEYIRTKLQYGPNPSGLQFIVLTHDNVMQKYFEGVPNGGNVKHQMLEGYPPGNLAIRGQDPTRIRHHASSYLMAGQVEAGGPWVRLYLECILMGIIRKLQVPVPIEFAVKDHKRMVSNCLDAIKAAVELHEKAGDIILHPTQLALMKNTYVPSIVANYVSHYETGGGGNVTPAMLLGTLQAIDDYADCFKYNHSATERRYYKSLTSR